MFVRLNAVITSVAMHAAVPQLESLAIRRIGAFWSWGRGSGASFIFLARNLFPAVLAKNC